MRFFRLAATVFLSLLIVSGATAATRAQTAGSAALAAPLDVRGFLLRADEASADTFTRTPSFAWKPVAGAKRYEFQLSTARTYGTGALIARKSTTAPAVSLMLALPWISGSPYSLYARARGIAPSGAVGPWSESFGFNMRWTNVPKPRSAPPGLLRWTTVDGAGSYEVWFLDLDKIIRTSTNVADEREYYTFHQDSTWSGVVHYRIRAIRSLYGLDIGNARNGLPATSYGPWSPTYSSTNPAFATGALQQVETIAGDCLVPATIEVPCPAETTSMTATPAAHHLMPAFAYSGDTGSGGTRSELYRVYVTTDRDCVNIVFKGAVVGGPAYAPRWHGTLALPRDIAGLNAARTKYIDSGDEGLTTMADNTSVTANEVMLLSGEDKITSGEDDSPSNPDTGTPLDVAPAAPPVGAPAVGVAKPTFAPASIPIYSADVGPPVDLWDTAWPTGRYFWTVVPVGIFTKPTLTTTLSALAVAGATTISISATGALAVGDVLTIGTGPAAESVSVVAASGGNITVSPALKNTHGAGDTVSRAGGNLTYRDLELPQDACAAGRVMTFGKTSELALSEKGNTPFASGLSPTGKLISAKTAKPSFYGPPLVSWEPAVAANAYEVQWSKTAYPFVTEATPALTFGTSTVLPLTAGTWYYRVRGINLGLPQGARAMAWSSQQPIIVAKPKFKIVKK
jgi:hypothetical protein